LSHQHWLKTVLCALVYMTQTNEVKTFVLYTESTLKSVIRKVKTRNLKIKERCPPTDINICGGKTEMKENDNVLKQYDAKEIAVGSSTGACNISIDAGSSESRTHVWHDNPKSGSIFGISSGYSIVSADMASIQAQSDTLYDNLEIQLEDLTDGKEEKVFENITIVKGGLLEDLRLPVAKTSSNVGKALQDTTYINAIANIGIRLYMAASTVGMYQPRYVCDVTLALPNEDVASLKRQEDVKNRLAGEYLFTLPRCKFSINIKINKDKILLVDEAKAALGSWRVVSKDKTNYENVLIIDAGGRSVDYSIMFKGRSLTRGSMTGKFGGQKFVDIIMEKYVNETGGDMPTKDMILDALDSGLLQDGNSHINICEFISKAKDEIAVSIGNDISSLLDANELRVNQLNLVLCAGRLMRETVCPDGEKVKSLCYNVENYIKKISPNTHVGLLEDEFALVRGLSLARHAFNMKNAGK